MSFQIKKWDSITASMINFVSGVTDKITDFNVGSVIRTLLEAIAMELEELYYQLLQATEEAIEEAIYRTFNFPRNPAQRSTGSVRFVRLTGTEVTVTIPVGTLVGTSAEPSIVFETQAQVTIPYLTGVATGGGATSLRDSTKNFTVLGVIVGSKVVDVTDNGETQPTGVTSITSTTNPNDTLNFAAMTGGAVFHVGDLYKVIVPYIGSAVQALVPGVAGNVAANSIIVLKSNVPNVESVTNLVAFSDGLEEETDLHRKARFALYIQSLARATRGALEYAAQTVEQVVAAKAIDDIRPLVYRHWIYGAAWTDITNSMRNPGDAYVKLFEDTEGQNDALHIGAKELFEYMNVHLGQIAVVAVKDLAWEYYNGSRWANLKADQVIGTDTNNYTCILSHLAAAANKPITGGSWATYWVAGGTLGDTWQIGNYHCDGSFVDGTDAGTGPLTQSGTVSFVPPSDWEANQIDTSISYVRLWIRLRKVLVGATFTTTPTGDWCSLPPGLGYVYLYCHDGSGDLSATLKASVENAVELYRGCGIVVEVKAPTKIIKDVECTVTIAANYDTTELGIKVTQAIKDFMNAKVLGEDLYLAELYQLIMGVNDKAILNCEITIPVADIIIPNSGIVRYGTVTVTILQEG